MLAVLTVVPLSGVIRAVGALLTVIAAVPNRHQPMPDWTPTPGESFGEWLVHGLRAHGPGQPGRLIEQVWNLDTLSIAPSGSGCPGIGE